MGTLARIYKYLYTLYGLTSLTRPIRVIFFFLNESTYRNFSAREVQYVFYKFMAEKCLLSLIRFNILTKGIFSHNNCIFSLGELPIVPVFVKGHSLIHEVFATDYLAVSLIIKVQERW